MPEPVPFSICSFSYTTLLFSPDGSKCFLGRLKSLRLYCLLINQNPKCLFSLSGCYAGKERFCLFLSFQNCPVVIIAVRLFFRPVFRVKRNGQRDLPLIFLYKNPDVTWRVGLISDRNGFVVSCIRGDRIRRIEFLFNRRCIITDLKYIVLFFAVR